MLSVLVSIPELEVVNRQLKSRAGETLIHTCQIGDVNLKFSGTVSLLDGKVHASGMLFYRKGRKILVYHGHWYKTILFASYFSYGPIMYSGKTVFLNGFNYDIKAEIEIVTHLRFVFDSGITVGRSPKIFILHVPIVEGAEFQLELDMDESIFDVTLGNSFPLVPGLMADKLVISTVGTDRDTMFNFVVCVESDRVTFIRTDFSGDRGNYRYEYHLKEMSPLRFLATVFHKLPPAPASEEILKRNLR